ncbi:MFS general substrate transporter [Testicularia cyperi]|uniref:MFS general substrate transporter n=1 Tax=Testicularia cyperi TaxID=1882483 RepID=A0A317XJK0_9BASI|nr:MFS general substrate transporter [Testicularia cyperi]
MNMHSDQLACVAILANAATFGTTGLQYLLPYSEIMDDYDRTSLAGMIWQGSSSFPEAKGTESDGSTSQLVASAAVPPNHVPPFTQSGLVLLLNFLLNITFFIIVPTSASYANELGASTWFSGLTIGISTLVAGSFLVPFSRRYSRVYKFPFLFASVCIMVGEVIYALAGVANTAWLMFLGRIVLGAGFVSWMYVKKYMTDSIVVGTSKRTMMSACLVTTQVGGMAVGPFIGGLLSKRVRPMTDSHRLWNGFTASGWIMAGVWLLFFALTWFVFREPAPPIASSGNSQIELGLLRDQRDQPLGPALASEPAPTLGGMMRELNATQKFSVMTMCWFSMVNFLVLGAWESNIPVFGHVRFGWSEYDAGNVIALGGLATLPLLFALVFVARYLQDRSILLAGLLLGLLGLSLHMGTLESPARSAVALLANTHASTSTSSASASASVSALATPTSKTNFGSFFTSWFLVALGYNMLTTITLSLLSKQIPAKFNGLTSTVIQLSNYTGRISGALWGSTLYQVGQFGIVTLELAVTLIGACLIGLMWRKIDVQKG